MRVTTSSEGANRFVLEARGISKRFAGVQALRDEDLDITLTDSFLMLPRKSTSGIIGLGAGSEVSDYNPCRTCNQKSCNGRRK